MRQYIDGCEVLGAGFGSASTQSPDVGPFVTIHVNDIAGLVKAQGGSTGALAQSILPKTIEKTVYDQLSAQIASGLKDKGVNADVRVVSNAPPGKVLSGEFLVSASIGAGAVGLIWLVKHFLGRKR